jgi:hypothetical protein
MWEGQMITRGIVTVLTDSLLYCLVFCSLPMTPKGKTWFEADESKGKSVTQLDLFGMLL